jgi:hypothetical protein
MLPIFLDGEMIPGYTNIGVGPICERQWIFARPLSLLAKYYQFESDAGNDSIILIGALIAVR